jgi:hypothetical protein
MLCIMTSKNIVAHDITNITDITAVEEQWQKKQAVANATVCFFYRSYICGKKKPHRRKTGGALLNYKTKR